MKLYRSVYACVYIPNSSYSIRSCKIKKKKKKKTEIIVIDFSTKIIRLSAHHTHNIEQSELRYSKMDGMDIDDYSRVC